MTDMRFSATSFQDKLVSVIVPTIGRPESLERLLDSLAAQSISPLEVLVADASQGDATDRVAKDIRWQERGLSVRHIRVALPNAVGQRIAAIGKSTGNYLLFLDDDVELERNCVAQLLKGMEYESGVVAVIPDLSNERWSGPTRAWRLYMRYVLGLSEGEWEGRVVGPLLRFGFPARRDEPAKMEWIASGAALISRAAYDKAGGFSDFFLHRCTMNEDVDLGLKLNRVGKILFWPAARWAHHHAPMGRVTVDVAAEDDLFNRYCVIAQTWGLGKLRALSLVVQFFLIESASNLAGSIRRRKGSSVLPLLFGRLRGLVRIVHTFIR